MRVTIFGSFSKINQPGVAYQEKCLAGKRQYNRDRDTRLRSNTTVKVSKPISQAGARALSDPYLSAVRNNVHTARGEYFSNRAALLKTNLNVNEHKEYMLRAS